MASGGGGLSNREDMNVVWATVGNKNRSERSDFRHSCGRRSR